MDELKKEIMKEREDKDKQTDRWQTDSSSDKRCFNKSGTPVN